MGNRKKKYHNILEADQPGTQDVFTIDSGGGGSAGGGIYAPAAYSAPSTPINAPQQSQTPVIDTSAQVLPVYVPPSPLPPVVDTGPVNTMPIAPANQAPKVNPGINQTITLPTDTIQLDGSKSYDPENGPLTFQWTLENGPTIPAIVNASKAIATVAGLEEGNYGFRLTITDGMGATDTGLVYINVQKPASVMPGADINVVNPPPAGPANVTTSSPAPSTTNNKPAPLLPSQSTPYQTSYSAPSSGTVETANKKKIDWLFWGIIAFAAGYIIFAKND